MGAPRRKTQVLSKTRPRLARCQYQKRLRRFGKVPAQEPPPKAQESRTQTEYVLAPSDALAPAATTKVFMTNKAGQTGWLQVEEHMTFWIDDAAKTFIFSDGRDTRIPRVRTPFQTIRQGRAGSLSMPDAFGGFYLDCEGEQSIEQRHFTIKTMFSEWTVWTLFPALLQ